MLPTKILEKYNVHSVIEAISLLRTKPKTSLYIAPLFKIPGDHVIILDNGRSVVFKFNSGIVPLSSLAADSLTFLESKAVASNVTNKLLAVLEFKPAAQSQVAEEEIPTAAAVAVPSYEPKDTAVVSIVGVSEEQTAISQPSQSVPSEAKDVKVPEAANPLPVQLAKKPTYYKKK